MPRIRVQRSAMAKPVLLLLPGLDGTASLFRWLIPMWSGMIDARPVSYPRNLYTYADALRHAEQQLPPEGGVFVLGECFSGPVAIQLAHRYPERVEGMVLTTSFATCPSMLLRSCKHLLAIPVSGFLMRTCAKTLTPGLDDAIKRELDVILRMVPSSVLMRRLQQVASVDVTSHLKELAQPILYLQGRQDRLVSTASARLVQQCAAQTRVVTLDAPHLLLQYAVRDAAAAILQFIDQHAHHHA